MGGRTLAIAVLSGFGMVGETMDIGVFGGSGIGYFGARGDSGRPPLIERGERGGDTGDPMFDPSLGSRGVGEPIGRFDGRGLVGRPGLIGGGETIRASKALVTSPIGWFRMKASESACGESSRE
jgi:hypothetical protein